MKPENPAKGILKVNEWGASKMYQVVCDCGNDECKHTVDIEADDFGITVTVYANAKLGWKGRWYSIWQLLTKGYANFETSLVLDKQVALNYASMLQSAVKDVDEFRKQNVKNKSS